MEDGHSGIENRKVNEGGTENFQLILAVLKHGIGRIDFVIHCTSNRSYSYGVQPLEFLGEIGLTSYHGQCIFHRDRCFYRKIAVLERDHDGFENHSQVQMVHNAFRNFAEKIDELFKLRPGLPDGPFSTC